VYYIECIELKNKNANLAQTISSHQYVDWRGLRHKSRTSREVKEKISNLARQIRDALEYPKATEPGIDFLGQSESSLTPSITPEAAVDVSTVFFDKRISSAFPGVRGVEWFKGKDAINRLSILLQEPLTFDIGRGARQPIWYWRDGNAPIHQFRVLDRYSVLVNIMELRIKRIAAIRSALYYRCFVYIEAEPMQPTGLYYPLSQEAIEMKREEQGYVSEEYGLYKGKYKVNRAQYDDNAAVIRGRLCTLGNDVELRLRYITPFNFVLAAECSPINNKKFDCQFVKLMDGILTGISNLENLVEQIKRLPRGADVWEEKFLYGLTSL
jgi:hypothetical protein